MLSSCLQPAYYQATSVIQRHAETAVVFCAEKYRLCVCMWGAWVNGLGQVLKWHMNEDFISRIRSSKKLMQTSIRMSRRMFCTHDGI